ncbi:MAG: fasciclin domain-containing protein [Granulosicoccus sp.]
MSVTLLSAIGLANASSHRDYRANNSAQSTITEIVSRSGGDFDNNNFDFDILLTSVGLAGLGDALDDRSANLTLLAPTDIAFIRLAQALGYAGDDEGGAFDVIVAALTDLGNGDPIPVLTDILLYHVLPERLSTGSIRRSGSLDTLLDDATITPDGSRLIDNEPDVRDPRFVRPSNIRATNGIVHTIDRVLIPLDLAPARRYSWYW